MGHTIFPRWYDSMEFQIGLIEITVITRISTGSKLMQVPFSFSKYRSHLASTVLWPIFCCAGTFSSNSHYRSLYRGHTNASYSLTGVSCASPGILKRFYALLLPICTFSHCLVHSMPPQSPKIEHLPSDASAILGERYLAGTFSVVPQWCWWRHKLRHSVTTNLAFYIHVYMKLAHFHA